MAEDPKKKISIPPGQKVYEEPVVNPPAQPAYGDPTGKIRGDVASGTSYAPSSLKAMGIPEKDWQAYSDKKNAEKGVFTESYLNDIGVPPEQYDYYAAAMKQDIRVTQPDAINRYLPWQSYWQNPQTVARWHNAFQALPIGAQLPPWIDRDTVETAYNYFKQVNGDNTEYWQWSPALDPKDPVREILGQLPTPPSSYLLNNSEQSFKPEAEKTDQAIYELYAAQQEQLSQMNQASADQSVIPENVPMTNGIPTSEWNKMAWYQQMQYQLTPYNSALTMAIMGAVQGAPGGLPGMVIGGLKGGLMGLGAGEISKIAQEKLAADPTYAGWETWVMNGMAVLDQGAMGIERSLGLIKQIEGSLYSPEKYGSLSELLKNPLATWRAGDVFYESGAPLFDPKTQEAYYEAYLPGQADPNITKTGIIRNSLGNDYGTDFGIAANLKSVFMNQPREIGTEWQTQAMKEARDLYINGAKPNDMLNDMAMKYGYQGQIQDLVGHIYLDPINATPQIYKYGAEKFAAMTENAQLAKAVTAIEQNGGIRITQLPWAYGVQLRKLTPDALADLGPVARWMAGVDNQGKMKILNPEIKKGFVSYLTNLTPRARASELLLNFANELNRMNDGLDDPNLMVKYLKGFAANDPSIIAEASIRIPWIQSTEGSALIGMMRDYDVGDVLLEQWNLTRPKAQIVQEMADTLGVEKPRDLITRIGKDPAEAQKILDEIHATKPDWNPDINAADLEDMARLFTKDGAPINIDEFKGWLYLSTLQHADKWAADWFKIKPDPAWLRISGLVKSATSLAVLAGNPVFAVNNFLDNMTLMAWDGVLGFRSPRTIDGIWEDYDISPARLDLKQPGYGSGDAAVGQVKGYEVGQEITKAAKTKYGNKDAISLGEDFFRSDGIQKISFATKFSGQIEEWSGKQAMTTAFLKSWEHWRNGDWYDKMPAGLSYELSKIDPSLPRMINEIISSSKRPEQLDEIWTGVKRMQVEGLAPRIAAQTGLEPAAVSEFLDTFISRDARQKLENAKNGKEILDAINNTESEINSHLDEMVRADAENIAQRTAAGIRLEGGQRALSEVGQLFIDYDEGWLKHTDDWQVVMAEARKHDRKTANIIIRNQDEKAQQEFSRMNNIADSKVRGIIRGLGADDPTIQRLETNLMDVRGMWDDFFQFRRKNLNEFFDTIYGDKSLTEDQVSQMFREVQLKIQAKAKIAYEVELSIQGNIDDIFVKQFDAQFKGGGDVAKQWRDGVSAVRQEMTAKMMEHRTNLLDLSGEARTKANNLFYTKTWQPLIRKLEEAELTGIQKFYDEFQPAPKGSIIPRVSIREFWGLVVGHGIGSVEEWNALYKQINKFLPDGTKPFNKLDCYRTFSPDEFDALKSALEARDQATGPQIRPQGPPPTTPPVAQGVEIPKPEDVNAPKVETPPVEPLPDQPTVGRMGQEVKAKMTLNGSTDADVKKIGFNERVHAMNAVNKRLGTDYKNFDDVPWIDVLDTARLKIAQLPDQDLFGGNPREAALNEIDNFQKIYNGIYGEPALPMEVENAISQAKASQELRFYAGEKGWQNVPGYTVREHFRSIMTEYFNAKPEEADAMMSIMDARAKLWAIDNGKDYLEYYAARIAGGMQGLYESGTPKDSPFQANGKTIYPASWKNMGAKARVTFLDDGRAILQGLIAPDISSVVHEVGHIFRMDLGISDVNIITNWLKNTHGIDVLYDEMTGKFLDDPTGKMIKFDNTDYQYSVFAEEAFAKGWEQYLREGLAPTEGMRNVFRKFSHWMRQIYSTLKGSEIDVKISKEMRQLYDRLISETPIERSSIPNRPAGIFTNAWGADPNLKFKFQFRLVDLDDLQTSNNYLTGAENPRYFQDLQERIRVRAGSKIQIEEIASKLDPEALLLDTHDLSKGAPIIGEDGLVESGNGRINALRLAQDKYAGNYQNYLKQLAESLDQFGLKPADMDGMKNPVLVRERITDVDRIDFASIANARQTLAMSPFEVALKESKILTDPMLATFKVGENQTMDAALMSSSNNSFISKFLKGLDENTRNELVDDKGALTLKGADRIKAAIFAKAFPSEAGQRLLEMFTESNQEVMKNLQSAMFQTIGHIAKLEGATLAGYYSKDLSIVDDVTKVADLFTRLRSSKMSVDDYLNQQTFMARELNPLQEKMLVFLDDHSRSAQGMSKLFTEYVNNVFKEALPEGQGALIEGVTGPTKDAIFEKTIKDIGNDEVAEATIREAKRQSKLIKQTANGSPTIDGEATDAQIVNTKLPNSNAEGSPGKPKIEWRNITEPDLTKIEPTSLLQKISDTAKKVVNGEQVNLDDAIDLQKQLQMELEFPPMPKRMSMDEALIAIKPLIEAAAQQKDQYRADLVDIANVVDGVSYSPKSDRNMTKGDFRAAQKLANGVIPTDLLRATFIVDDMSKLDDVMQGLYAKGYQVYKNPYLTKGGMRIPATEDISNLYQNDVPEYTGYKHIAIKLVSGGDDPVVKELQIMTPQIAFAKDILGWDVYAVRRNISKIQQILPEFAQSTQADEIMLKYSQALYDFAGGLDSKSAVLAITARTISPSLVKGMPDLSNADFNVLRSTLNTLMQPSLANATTSDLDLMSAFKGNLSRFIDKYSELSIARQAQENQPNVRLSYWQKKGLAPTESGFFDDTFEDMPLMSGTAPRVGDQTFDPGTVNKQLTIFDGQSPSDKNTRMIVVRAVGTGINTQIAIKMDGSGDYINSVLQLKEDYPNAIFAYQIKSPDGNTVYKTGASLDDLMHRGASKDQSSLFQGRPELQGMYDRMQGKTPAGEDYLFKIEPSVMMRDTNGSFIDSKGGFRNLANVGPETMMNTKAWESGNISVYLDSQPGSEALWISGWGKPTDQQIASIEKLVLDKQGQIKGVNFEFADKDGNFSADVASSTSINFETTKYPYQTIPDYLHKVGEPKPEQPTIQYPNTVSKGKPTLADYQAGKAQLPGTFDNLIGTADNQTFMDELSVKPDYSLSENPPDYSLVQRDPNSVKVEAVTDPDAMHGGMRIIGNVYKDGKIVAYLPERYSVSDWQNGPKENFRILGLDVKDDRYWVMEMEDGGIRRMARDGVEMGAAVNTPLGSMDSMNPNAPLAEGMTETYRNEYKPIMAELRRMLTDPANVQKTVKVGRNTLSPDMAGQLDNYLTTVKGQMSDAKLGAVRISENVRDFALLNYNRKFGADNVAQTIYPFETWYSRNLGHWAQRFIDNPTRLTNYYRLMKFSDQNKRNGFPTRLEGKSGFRIPFLPEAWGDSMWIDPMSKIFPWLRFLDPFKTVYKDSNMVNQRARSIVQDWINDESITGEEGTAVLSSMTGPIWDKAREQATKEVDTQVDNPADFMNTILSPNIFVNWAYQALVKHTPGRIGQLPFTRLIASTTALAGIGGPGGVNLESGIRKTLGLPEISEFNDIAIDKELSNMVAMGQTTLQDAELAMMDRTGQLFDQAKTTVGQQAGLKYFFTVVGGDLYPKGEEKLRSLYDDYQVMLAKYSMGDNAAYQAFFDKYPEYKARQMSFKKPEDRMRRFLTDQVWERYLALPDVNQAQAQEMFGKQFNDAFLAKATRSYDSISKETLVFWAQTLGGVVPQSAPVVPNVQSTVMEIPDQEVMDVVKQYRDEKDKLFPRLSTEYDFYYALPEGPERDKFAKTTSINAYYKWRTNFMAAHPETAPYIDTQMKEAAGLPKEDRDVLFKYEQTRQLYFPNVETTQTEYFNQENYNKQRAFLKNHPELSSYWEFKRYYASQYPKIASYIISDLSLSKAIYPTAKYGEIQIYPDVNPKSELPQALIDQMDEYFIMGKQLSQGAFAQLKQYWQQLGSPGDFYKFVDSLRMFF